MSKRTSFDTEEVTGFNPSIAHQFAQVRGRFPGTGTGLKIICHQFAIKTRRCFAAGIEQARHRAALNSGLPNLASTGACRGSRRRLGSSFSILEVTGGRHVRVEAPRRAVTLDEVRAHRNAITQLGERFGVRNIRVFGSVARGEATSGSDLDLLVDVDRGHGYFDMAGFALGVEDELGVMTQVATAGGLKLRIRDRVLREAVAL